MLFIDIDTNISLADRLVSAMVESAPFISLVSALKGAGGVSAGGLPGSMASVLVAALCRQRRVTIVAPDSERSEALLDDLYLLMDEREVCFLPPGGKARLRRLTPESAQHHRAEALLKLSRERPACLIVLPGTLLEKFPSIDGLKNGALRIEQGMEIQPMLLMRRLLNAGFRREVQVEGCGETALRGGILDLFPYGSRFPLRLEFWGDEVHSLREFDPRNQRSIKILDSADVFIGPSQAAEDTVFSLMDGIIFWDDMDRIVSRYESIAGADHNPLDIVPAGRPLLFHNPIEAGDINFGGTAPEMFLGSTDSFSRMAQKRLDAGFGVMMGTESPHRLERFIELMGDERGEILDRMAAGVLPLQSGFVFPAGKTAFFTEKELFDRPRPRRSFARFRTYAHPIELEALKSGDYVVHEDFGIGIYRGLKKIKVAGHERECLNIEYRDQVRLYVRIEAFARVQKYAGRDGFIPAVNKIGGMEWKRARKKTQKALMEMARELISLQAKRVVKEGIAFSADDIWQKQLEDSFSFIDTPDQSRAAVEVKKDMESGRPMDRLLLGDVGFGKTEIAVRAAFKAVQSGCQAAVLAPTTILVQQHLETFKERMKEYPVFIESLSRFRTPREQREALKGLRSGAVDIVIGTHRLLSRDVTFRRLGLLIIDEEHRFGVKHKEKLKRLREEVDVLTLTATPIPRTLHLALMGARDLSRIETPPENRLSITTEIVPFDKGVIREAILREMSRGGQVFFIHNRVRSIGAVHRMLCRVAPEARFGIAHGQMSGRGLERVMLDFMHKKFDCLICTMIIESGIDLPNVNTMIINRADKMGLAQLYQLRGRIGRSDRRAFAYMLIPPKLGLSREARRRLETIAYYSELGAGFQVALKDLEIRGAGNLLGAQQSGFINSIGFDLYSSMLEEAVAEARSELTGESAAGVSASAREAKEVKLDFAGDAHIPENYIFEEDLRVNFYRKLSSSGTEADLNKLEVEMTDRFGRFPSELKNLFWLLKLKIIAREAGVVSVSVNSGSVRVDFGVRDDGYKDIIQRAVAATGDNRFEFIPDPPFSIKVFWECGEDWESQLRETEKFMTALIPDVVVNPPENVAAGL